MTTILASDFSDPVIIRTAPIMIEIPSVLYGRAYDVSGTSPTVFVGSAFRSNYHHVAHTHSEWNIETPARAYSRTITNTDRNPALLFISEVLRGTVRMRVRYGSNHYTSFVGDPTPTQTRWSPWSNFMDVVIS